MTAELLVEALRRRHADALFVDECKLGEQGSRRLDAWVLLKTWSPQTTIGYEVKVTRQDFLSDRKWPDYLPVCHEFYFVCPRGLIAPEELGEGAGLLWTAGNNGRLVTKRRAERRRPEPGALIDLMTYVLMSRTRIVANMWQAKDQQQGADYWRRWLEERRDAQGVGHQVSARLGEALREARAKQRAAEGERDRLAGVRDALRALGLDEHSTSWDVTVAGRSNEAVVQQLSEVERLLRQVQEAINRVRKVALATVKG